jgi:hypothetical protein
LEVGDEEATKAELNSRLTGDGRAWSLRYYIPLLYGEGNFDEALGLLSTAKNPPGDEEWLRAMILAALPGKAQEAYQVWKAVRVPVTGDWDLIMWPLPLQMMGRSEEATQAFASVRPQITDTSRNGWYQRLADFEAGVITEEQLLKIAGNSQWDLCEGHFYIGLKRLSQGDRSGARAEFEKAADTPVILFFEYRWSKAFQRRMDADPKWPWWLPASPSHGAATMSVVLPGQSDAQ